jgi:hypothetical protein
MASEREYLSPACSDGLHDECRLPECLCECHSEPEPDEQDD